MFIMNALNDSQLLNQKSELLNTRRGQNTLPKMFGKKQ